MEYADGASTLGACMDSCSSPGAKPPDSTCLYAYRGPAVCSQHAVSDKGSRQGSAAVVEVPERG